METILDEHLTQVFEYLTLPDAALAMTACKRFRMLVKGTRFCHEYPVKLHQLRCWRTSFPTAKCLVLSHECVDDDVIYDLARQHFFSTIDTLVLNYVEIDGDDGSNGLLTGKFFSFLPKHIKHLHLRAPLSSESLNFKDSDFAVLAHLSSLTVYRMWCDDGLTNGAFSNFANLRYLDMSETELTDDALRALTLESLSADECKITGEGINFSFLKKLSIMQCPLIKQDLFKGIDSNLVDLNVWNCEHLTDAFFQDLKAAQTVKLKRLNIWKCAYTANTLELFPHALVSGCF